MAGKGRVIEVKKGKAVVMTDQCEFIELRLKSPVQVGAEIDYELKDLYVHRHPGKIMALAASLLLCLLAAYVSVQYFAARNVYAVVAFDINPSFELRINQTCQVTVSRWINKDGQDLLRETDINNKTFEAAFSELLRQYQRSQYFKPEKTNSIAVSIYLTEKTNDKKVLSYIEKTIIQELNKSRIKATLYFFTVDKSTYEMAVKNKVSPARFLLREEARKTGLNFELNDQVAFSDPQFQALAAKISYRVVNVNLLNQTDEDLPSTNNQHHTNTMKKSQFESSVAPDTQNFYAEDAAPDSGHEHLNGSSSTEPGSTTAGQLNNIESTSPASVDIQTGSQSNSSPGNDGNIDSNIVTDGSSSTSGVNINDLTGDEAAGTESNPYGSKSENSSNNSDGSLNQNEFSRKK